MPKKILLLFTGAKGVGKTELIYNFNSKRPDYLQGGSDYYSTFFMDKKEKIFIDIYTPMNTGSISSFDYKRAHGIVVMYDVTNPLSFTEIDNILPFIKENYKTSIVYIVGNKTDIKGTRKVSYEEGYAKSLIYKCMFAETSALDTLSTAPFYKNLLDEILITAKIEKTINLNYDPEAGGGCMGKNTCQLL